MINGDIGLASSVSYQLFLYRSELKRRRQQPVLRQQTKIELTQGLINSCMKIMRKLDLSDMLKLSREVNFKELMQQQLTKLENIQRSFNEMRQPSSANIVTLRKVTVQQWRRQQEQIACHWPDHNYHLPMQQTPPLQQSAPQPSLLVQQHQQLPQLLYTETSSYALHLQMEHCVTWQALPPAPWWLDQQQQQYYVDVMRQTQQQNFFCHDHQQQFTWEDQQQEFQLQAQQQYWAQWQHGMPMHWHNFRRNPWDTAPPRPQPPLRPQAPLQPHVPQVRNWHGGFRAGGGRGPFIRFGREPQQQLRENPPRQPEQQQQESINNNSAQNL